MAKVYYMLYFKEIIRNYYILQNYNKINYDVILVFTQVVLAKAY